MICIIAAIGKKNELGKENKLLWDLPEDLKHFKDKTRGSAIIMGRKTFDSIGRPLPARRNIVISRDKTLGIPGAEIASSLEEAIEMAKESDESENKEIFIIGGGGVYAQALPIADKLYLTHVDTDFPDADTFFPEVNCDEWEMIETESHEKDEHHAYDYRFATYIRK